MGTVGSIGSVVGSVPGRNGAFLSTLLSKFFFLSFSDSGEVLEYRMHPMCASENVRDARLIEEPPGVDARRCAPHITSSSHRGRLIIVCLCQQSILFTTDSCQS